MDKLFLLKPGFADSKIDEGKLFYCPDCAAIEGVLSYYPQLRERLEIIYVDFPRPRKEIIQLIGEANQGCPVLILDAANVTADTEDFARSYNGISFIDLSESIMNYLAAKYAISFPHP